MCTSLIKNLKNLKSDIAIDLLTNNFATSLLSNNPDIAHIYPVKFPWGTGDYSLRNLKAVLSTLKSLSNKNYDLIIDGQIDFFNIFSMFIIGAKNTIAVPLCGGKYLLSNYTYPPNNIFNMIEVRNYVLTILDSKFKTQRAVFLYPNHFDYQTINSFLNSNSIVDNYICIHPGASQSIKRWPLHLVSKLINKLHSIKIKVIAIEGPGESKDIQRIKSMCPESFPIFKGSLLQVAALIHNSDLIVSMDSVSAHIANAMSTKGLILFGGHQDPEVINPNPGLLKSITPENPHEGISGISIDDVFDEIIKII